ncbi:MAG TPA: sulfotransferase, partial [Devosia sp.]|nr:sulfotransferase [Devosia sp.]
ENVRALDGLTRLNRFTSHDDDIKNMEALFERKTLSAPEQMVLAFSLAKAFEDIGEYSLAFDYLQRGNSLNRKTFVFSKSAIDSLFSDIAEAFDAETFSKFSGAGNSDETPIFILGMPRSGTSLVEQVLSSHRDVTGAGELSIMNTIAGRFVADPAKPDFGEAVARASLEKFGGLGRDYMEQLRRYSSSARFITDKMPGNSLYIGLIKLILPKAKIVHCRRNAADTCLSIYKTHFSSGGLHYAYDLDELGHYYRHYEKLMEHWHQVLPGFVYDLNYEDLIGDQRAETERLLDWCGLDWSEDCMNFFNTKRLVNTASIAQVRQPVYSSSIRLWQKYGSALNPLLEALGKTG